MCIKHFEKESVIYTDKITSTNVEVIEYPRKYLKLADGAFPKIFPYLPAYLLIGTPVM